MHYYDDAPHEEWSCVSFFMLVDGSVLRISLRKKKIAITITTTIQGWGRGGFGEPFESLNLH